MGSYSITYQIVTEESLQDGDVAEHGFLIDGIQCPMVDGQVDGDPREECPSDWTGFSDNYPAERYAASVLLSLPGTIEPSTVPWAPGSWYTVYPDSDDHWTAETEDGTVGTRSLGFHLEGWSEEEERRIYSLIRQGNADAPLD